MVVRGTRSVARQPAIVTTTHVTPCAPSRKARATRRDTTWAMTASTPPARLQATYLLPPIHPSPPIHPRMRAEPSASHERTTVHQSWRWIRCLGFLASRSRDVGCMSAHTHLCVNGVYNKRCRKIQGKKKDLEEIYVLNRKTTASVNTH